MLPNMVTQSCLDHLVGFGDAVTPLYSYTALVALASVLCVLASAGVTASPNDNFAVLILQFISQVPNLDNLDILKRPDV